jgi:hypothetical protein
MTCEQLGQDSLAEILRNRYEVLFQCNYEHGNQLFCVISSVAY